MMKALFTLLFIGFIKLSYAQNDPESAAFIQDIVDAENVQFYHEEIGKFTVEQMTKAINSSNVFGDFYNRDPKNTDLLKLTDEEKVYINGELSKMSAHRWTEGLLKNAKMITADTITAIFKDKLRGWDYLYKQNIHKIYGFSKPIFFRNNALCVFYREYGCGYLCAEGNMAIYRKENGIWKKWLMIYTMVS